VLKRHSALPHVVHSGHQLFLAEFCGPEVREEGMLAESRVVEAQPFPARYIASPEELLSRLHLVCNGLLNGLHTGLAVIRLALPRLLHGCVQPHPTAARDEQG
jgi:hypothetical protein